MNIVIAPHPDDCLIGCYSLIKKGLIDGVVYLDATPERLGYAQKFCAENNLTICHMDFDYLHTFLSMSLRAVDKVHPGVAFSYNVLGIESSDPTFLVPDIADSHLLHKAVNCVARLSGCKLGYYSVDMNTGYTKELSKVDQQEKREALNHYYPDQSSLWENNWKYFLFEGIVFERYDK